MGKDNFGIEGMTVTNDTNELEILFESKQLKFIGSWRLHQDFGNYYRQETKTPLNFDILIRMGKHNFPVHPEDVDFLIQKLSEPGIQSRFEIGIRMITSDGIIRQFQASGRVVDPGEINRAEIREVETQIELESRMFQYTESATETGSWKWNVKKNIVSFTENIYRIYGIDPIIALKTWDDLLPYVVLNDRHKVGELVTVLKKSGDSTTLDYRINRSNDQALRYLRTKAEIILTTTGEIFCIGTTRDITREKLTEEKIEEVEVRASRIHEEALAKIGWQESLFKEAEVIGQMGSYEIDVPEMRLKLSDNMFRLLGFRPGAFPPTLEFIDSVSDKHDATQVRAIIEGAIRDKKSYQYQRYIYLPNGQVRHLTSRGRVVLDKAGNVCKLVGIVQDVTSQVALELSLKENPIGSSANSSDRSDDAEPLLPSEVHPEIVLETSQKRNQQRVRKILHGIFEAIPLDLVYLRASRNSKNEVDDFIVEIINDSCLHRIRKGKEVIGSSVKDVIPGIETQRLWASMQQVYQSRTPEQRESRFKKNDLEQWVCTSTIPFSDGVLVAVLDISAQKTAEKELEDSRHFVQQVTEHSPDFIFVLDLVSGKPVYSNRSIYKILGYHRKHMPPQEETFMENLIHPEDLESRYKQLSMIRDCKCGEVIEMELRLKHFNGTWEWFNVRETKIDHAMNDQPLQVLGVVRNISKQKKAEEEMNKHLQILKQTEDVAGIGSWEYIMPNKQFNWSHGMYRMFGLPEGTPVTPESYRNFVVDEDYALVEKFVYNTRVAFKSFEEIIRIRVNGKVKSVKVKSTVINNDRGLPVKVLGVDLDISAIVDSEKEINDQAHFISRIVETIPDMLSVMELPSRIMTYVNQGAFLKQGFDPAAWSNQSRDDSRYMIHPDDVDVVDDYFEKFFLLADNTVNTIEYRGRQSLSAPWSWFKARGAVFKRNQEGIPTHCVNVVQNINTQKQTEEKVLEQGHYIQRLVETVPDTIFIFDLNLNRLIYSNPGVQQLLGYTPDEIQLLGAEVLDRCVFPEDREFQKEDLLKSVDAADNEVFESLLRMVHKDGTIRRVQVRRTPFKRGTNGKVSQVVSIFRDITSLKLAEEENLLMKEMLTRQAEDKYRQLFNSIDEGFCILDIIFDDERNPVDYCFIETNPAFEKQTGLMQSKGNRMRQLCPDHDDYWYETFGEVVKTGEPKQFLRFVREFGSRWFEVYAFAVSPGNNTTVAVLFNDVTEWRKTEQQLKELNDKLQESDRAKTIFFSNVSHEFRTPLTLLLGPLEELLELAEKSKADRDEIEKLKLAHRNALRLQKLVNSLLDFSKLEAGRLDASFTLTDLGKFTSDLASNFRSVIENGGVRFGVLTDNYYGQVLVDREMWEKIVFNLLSNAFKFTFTGEIEIAVTSFENEVELMVRDTGSGIAAEHVPRLFDRFHRIEGTPSRAYEGSGIGLALVHELVKIHGGSIFVDSEPGKGTAFYVRIPASNGGGVNEKQKLVGDFENRAEYKEFAAKFSDAPSLVDYSNAHDYNAGVGPRIERAKLPLIILADDHADMREYLRSMLHENFDVIPVENGQRVLDLLVKGFVPDLILSDVMMPELDGFELLQKIKSNSSWNRIPVILVSARAGEEARVEGMEYGADDYLVKPFSARELKARLNARIEIATLRNQREDLLKDVNLQLEKHVFERTRELLESRDDLQKQKELLQRCLDALPQLVWTTDPLGKFMMFNDRWYSYTGLPFEMAEGATYIKSGVIHPSQVKEVESKWQFSINEGIPYSNETLIRHKDGEYRWHLDLVMPIKNEFGEIFMWVGTLTDVNEQFVAEKRLEDHKNLLETIFDFSPSGIQVLDSVRDDDTNHIIDFEWRYFNATIRDIFDNRDLLGKRFSEVYPDSLKNGMMQILREVVVSGEPSRYEQKYPFNSSEFWLDVSVVKLEDSVVLTWHNITDRVNSELELTQLNGTLKQKNQELEGMNEQLSTFAFVASHDLREPLRKIQFFVSSIKQTDATGLSERGLTYFNKILLAVGRMDALINDILKFSRANANSEDFEVVDLNKVLVIATNDLSETIREKGAVISANTLPSIRGNQTQLIQLFENLISNGIKFQKEGTQPSVDIETRSIFGKAVNHPSVVPEKEYVIIEVSDNGIGFEEQYISKIFQMFQRLHGITEYPGTGMGLAICKKIVENHGGFIIAQSTPGKGASFSCYFPK